MRGGMLMLLVATAMAVLLAGCGSSQSEEDQSSSQGSKQEEGSSQQTSEAMTNEQTSDPATNDTVEASVNGKITFFRGTGDGSNIYEMNADGTGVTSVTDPSLAPLSLAISPDGEKIAFVNNPPDDLYVMNADGTDLTHIFHQQGPLGLEGNPVFSPDGKRIAFVMYPSGSVVDTEIYVINTDGTGLTRITTMEGDESDLIWSRNGTKMFFVNSRSQGGRREPKSQAYEMNADGSGLTKISNTPQPGVEGVPSSPPDCKKVAFLRNDMYAGDTDIYVRYPDGREVQITDDPPVYANPVLSPDCKWIAFTLDRTPEHEPGQYQKTYNEIYVITADGTGRKTRLTKGHVDHVLVWRSE
jgi:Tol biopolymer transport system component